MTGIRIDDQLCIRNVLSQRERVDRRHHDVIVAVHDQRGLLDFLEIGVTLPAGAPPFFVLLNKVSIGA